MRKVSVIIPTYNRAAMVEEAVRSVLDQTWRNVEIIVVDDGSTDGTAEAMRRLSERVRCITQPNRGRSNARNHGLAEATGDYVTFLDSDDLYLPLKVEREAVYLDEHPEAMMVYSSATCIDESGRDLAGGYEAASSGNLYRRVAFYLPLTIALPTVMVRKEVLDGIGGFDETMDRFEDTDMWRRIAKRYPVHGIPEPLCKLRSHGDNVLQSQDPEELYSSIAHYIEKVFREDADQGRLFLRRGASRMYLHYGRSMFVHPDFRPAARRCIVKAIRYWPVGFLMYLRLLRMVLGRTAATAKENP